MAARQFDVRISRQEYEALGRDPWDTLCAAFDHVWGEERADEERVRRFAQLTPGQRVMVPLSSLHADVVNGGLCQYLRNAGSMFCHEALEGLVEIGARHSELLARAIAVFPEGLVPRRWEDRLLGLYAGDRARLDRELEAMRIARAQRTWWNSDRAEERIAALLDELTREYFRLEESRRTSVEHRLARRYVRKHLGEFVRGE